MDIIKETVLRACKDEQYRSSLPDEARQQIPHKPTGDDGSGLNDDQLEAAAGGLVGMIAAVAAGTLAAGGAGYGVSEVIAGEC